jgi:hypothetical protein
VYKLTVVSNPELGGNFTYDPPLCAAKTYNDGIVVTVTAFALDGFEFQGWAGDIGDNAPGNATIHVTMNKERSITANFVALYNVLVTASPVSGGTILVTTVDGSFSTSANQTALSIPYAMGTVLLLSAIPASGYKFDRWNGNLTGYQGNLTEGNLTQGNITLVVNSPQIITAEFSRTTPWGGIIGGIAALLVVSFVGVSIFRGRKKKPEAVVAIPDGPKETETAPVTDTAAPAEPEPEQSPSVVDAPGDKS